MMPRQSWTDERLDHFEKRVDERFDRIDAEFARIDKRFEQVDKRFERVEGEIQELRRAVERQGTIMISGFVGLAGLIVSGQIFF